MPPLRSLTVPPLRSLTVPLHVWGALIDWWPVRAWRPRRLAGLLPVILASDCLVFRRVPPQPLLVPGSPLDMPRVVPAMAPKCQLVPYGTGSAEAKLWLQIVALVRSLRRLADIVMTRLYRVVQLYGGGGCAAAIAELDAIMRLAEVSVHTLCDTLGRHAQSEKCQPSFAS